MQGIIAPSNMVDQDVASQRYHSHTQFLDTYFAILLLMNLEQSCEMSLEAEEVENNLLLVTDLFKHLNNGEETPLLGEFELRNGRQLCATFFKRTSPLHYNCIIGVQLSHVHGHVVVKYFGFVMS